MSGSQLNLLDEFEPVSYETWRAVVEKDLKGAPFDKKLITHTYEGIDLHPVYTKTDWSADGDPSGFAGFDPFTRGRNAIGGNTCGWDIRQEHAHAEVKETNRLVLADLERGCTAVHLRFDVAGRGGLDPDTATDDLIGRDGVMLHKLADLEAALAGVHLNMCGLGIEAGAAFKPAAAMVAGLWDKMGVDDRMARGSFNADPLSVIARDGQLPYSIDSGMQQLAELASWTSDRYPGVTAVRVGSAPYHHAGATAVQDLAISMSTGVAYLRAMTDAGMAVEDAVETMLFNYAVGTNFFLAASKLRAARKLWARIIEACGVMSESRGMKMHVKTSKRVVTQRDPWVNMLRNTACCFAGAVAGADVITTYPFDKAVGLPDDFSRRIARNTQIILMEESHLNAVVDPAGGCWFIESLTDELAEKAWAMFQEIEGKGGIVEALTSGWIGEQIDSAFAPRLKNIARRRDAVTGVSEFPNVSEKPVKRREPNYDALRATAKAAVSDTAVDDTSMDGLVDAFKNGAMIGRAAKAVWGDAEPTSSPVLSPNPYAKPFEELRDAADVVVEQLGNRPKVFLANMGPVAHHTLRATYAKNFFEAGGFEVVSNKGFDSAEDAVKAFTDSGANIAVICSSDKLYPEFVPTVAPALKKDGARTVILAGAPGEAEATYREAGVDRFIFMKCDVLGILRELLQEEGVLV